MEKLSLEILKNNKLTDKSLKTLYGGDKDIELNDTANLKIARIMIIKSK